MCLKSEKEDEVISGVIMREGKCVDTFPLYWISIMQVKQHAAASYTGGGNYLLGNS